MTIDQAVEAFKEMLASAPEGEKVAHVHLFGIKYSDALDGLSLSEICIRSGEPESYATEISKGRRLAPYVDIR